MEFCDSSGQPLDYAGKVDNALLLAKVPGPPWVEDGSVKNYAELVARAPPSRCCSLTVHLHYSMQLLNGNKR